MTYLNIRNFDTSKLTTMEYMFYRCYVLTSIDVSSFDTTNVKSMRFMFNNCNSLKELDLYNFNTLNCDTFTSMFTGVNNIRLIVNNSTSYNLVDKLPKGNNITVDYR